MNEKYKIWGTQGQGSGETPDKEFPTLKEALTFVEENKDDASWAIEYPDGTWHTERQEDAIGQDIETLDNLAHALLLPMPADFHVRQLKSALPELVKKLKQHYADAFGWNPWEGHPDG